MMKAKLIVILLVVLLSTTFVSAGSVSWSGGVWHRPTLEDRKERINQVFGGTSAHDLIAQTYEKSLRVFPIENKIVRASLKTCGVNNLIQVVNKKDCLKQAIGLCNESCVVRDTKQHCKNSVVARCNYVRN